MTDVTNTPDSPEKTSKKSSLGKIALLLFLTGILLLLSWLGLKAWRLYQTSSSLLSRQAELKQLAAGGWEEIDADAAEAAVLGLRGDIVTLQAETGFLMPFLPYLAPLPEIGALAVAAPHLLEMADAGSEGAAYAIRGMKPGFNALQSETEEAALLPVMLETVDGARPELAKAALSLNRVAEAREQITDIDALPWRVRTLLNKGDEWLTIGQEFTRVSVVLPELMGLNGPRRYLILAQNEDELRPTGGFISGAGYLEVEDGEIVSLDFGDANLVDAWEQSGATGGTLAKPYDVPPQPLQDFMLLELFLFRDSNFWPDFPVSGQKGMDFYAYGRDVPPLDGAIGINQQFLQLLLNGVGPVTIAETGEVVSSKNVVTSLQESWTLEGGVSERKAFLGPFAAAIQQRIDEGSADIDPLYLAHQLSQALDQKDLQVYVRDQAAASVLAANNWDGRLSPPESGDALMIADTNVGYNKANFAVDRAASYDVRLVDEGDSQAHLEITHIHRGEASDDPCWQGSLEEYRAGAAYLALTDKCYWNYLRVYVPEGSQLESGPQHLIPGQTWFGGYDWQPATESLAELPGYTTFASWLLLPRGEEIVSEYQYSLPDSIVQHSGDGLATYTLRLRKQAGARPHHFQVAITPPPGKDVVSTSPDAAAVEGDTYFFSVELDGDQDISLTYR